MFVISPSPRRFARSLHGSVYLVYSLVLLSSFGFSFFQPAMLPASILVALVGFVLRVERSKEVIINEISYFAAQPPPGGEVEAEMLAGEDAA